MGQITLGPTRSDGKVTPEVQMFLENVVQQFLLTIDEEEAGSKFDLN